MEKNSNKLQVEILSASNVLSNFSNSNKFTSYLSEKYSTPLNNEYSKNLYASSVNKSRGFSVEASILMKKEPESAYFMKSPLICNTDSKKNSSFSNYLNSFEGKKFEMDSSKNMMKSSVNRDEVSNNNQKVMRNNSMNKLTTSKNFINDSLETPKAQIKKNLIEKSTCELNSFVPKTFLFNNNTKENVMLSSKQAKMERIYEQIKQFQSNKKRKLEVDQQKAFNSEEKVKISIL